MAVGTGLLHCSADWSNQAGNPFPRSREGRDLEPDHTVTVDGDEEQLLALFGMSRKCPIGESPSVRLINDPYNPARGGQRQPGRPQAHQHGGPRFDGCAMRQNIDPRDLVGLPSLQAR